MRFTLTVWDDEITNETFTVTFSMPYQELALMSDTHAKRLALQETVGNNVAALAREAMQQAHQATGEFLRSEVARRGEE